MEIEFESTQRGFDTGATNKDSPLESTLGGLLTIISLGDNINDIDTNIFNANRWPESYCCLYC